MSGPGYYGEYAFEGFPGPAESVSAVIGAHASALDTLRRPGNPPGSHGIAPPSNAVLTPDNPDAASSTKHCSVRGCNVLLAAAALTKMCDGCRERHREYALTKRRKRKAEKAAVLATVAHQHDAPPEDVWSPPVHALEPGNPTSEAVKAVVSEIANPRATSVGDPIMLQSDSGKNYRFHVPPVETDPEEEVPSAAWLDPALYTTQSSSSELAGALTLPPLPPRQHYEHEHSPFHGQSPEEIATAVAAQFVGTFVPSDAGPSTTILPPRFCSVKGCKSLVPGDYLYKMCESCRNRYRSYGNTKRAKWKAQSVAARTHLALLEKVREAEERARVERGLPSLSNLTTDEQRHWEDRVLKELKMQLPPDAFAAPAEPSADTLGDMEEPAATGTGAIRMCSVSHCKEILPAGHKFRRCEAHRVQNRMHSRLKRDREIERKTQGNRELHDAHGGWALDLGPVEQLYEQEPDEGMPLPPAIRGTRRTNHVCSIPKCFNLLAPSSPWKMCDPCRERDRAQRAKVEKMRREGMEFCATRGCHELLDAKLGVKFCDGCTAQREAEDREKEERTRVREERERKAREKKEEKERAMAEREARALSESVANTAAVADQVEAIAEKVRGSLAASQTPIPETADIPPPFSDVDAAPGSAPLPAPDPPAKKKRAPRKKKDGNGATTNDAAATSSSGSAAGPANADPAAKPTMPITAAPPSGTFSYSNSTQQLTPPAYVPYYQPPPYGMPQHIVQGPDGQSYAAVVPHPYYHAMPPPPPQQPASTSSTGSTSSATSPPQQSQYPAYPFPYYAYPPPGFVPAPAQAGSSPAPMPYYTPSFVPAPTAKPGEVTQWSPFAPPPGTTGVPMPGVAYVPTSATPSGPARSKSKKPAAPAADAPPLSLVWKDENQTSTECGTDKQGHPTSKARAPKRRRLMTDQEAAAEQARIIAAASAGAEAVLSSGLAAPGSPNPIETMLDDELNSQAAQTHTCANKTCNRALPTQSAKQLCEKCKARLKKHQVQAKQKFHLEPKKPITPSDFPSTA